MESAPRDSGTPRLTIEQIAGLGVLAIYAVAWSNSSGLHWGVHAGAFLPATLRAALIAAAAVTIVAAPRVARIFESVPRTRVAIAYGLAALAATLWWLRERLYFLGDAKAMLVFYETRRVGTDGHAYLTTAINYNLARAADSLFRDRKSVV